MPKPLTIRGLDMGLNAGILGQWQKSEAAKSAAPPQTFEEMDRRNSEWEAEISALRRVYAEQVNQSLPVSKPTIWARFKRWAQGWVK